jgi:hypothetical protein
MNVNSIVQFLFGSSAKLAIDVPSPHMEQGRYEMHFMPGIDERFDAIINSGQTFPVPHYPQGQRRYRNDPQGNASLS